MPEAIPRLVPAFSIAKVIGGAIERAQASGALEFVLVARPDGLAIGHNFPDHARARHLAAMSAAIFGTGQMAAKELGRGRVRGATLDTEGGQLVCLSAGEHAIVAGLAAPGKHVGLMLLVLQRLAGEIEEAIRRWDAESGLGR